MCANRPFASVADMSGDPCGSGESSFDSVDAVTDGQDVGRTENHDHDLSGGRREDRTRDLRVANAALSQLS